MATPDAYWTPIEQENTFNERNPNIPFTNKTYLPTHIPQVHSPTDLRLDTVLREGRGSGNVLSVITAAVC